jgi:cathepsin L
MGFSLEQSSVLSPLPKAVSWANLEAMQHVKSQGSCGSCWAVAVSVVLQAHAEIYAHKPNRTFSAQELVSCVPNPDACGGDGGCRGATAELAFDYVNKHGIATENEFPYQAADITCPHSLVQVHVEAGSRQLLRRLSRTGNTRVAVESDNAARMDFGMQGFLRLPENKYEPLKRAVAEKGPVAVAVAADGQWFSYGKGVFDECDSRVINHAVVLIGYGVDAGSSLKFWNIQNSWGSAWGEYGFIRLVRGDDESNCGIDRQPEQGTACRGGPKEVTVCGACGILYDTALPLLANRDAAVVSGE